MRLRVGFLINCYINSDVLKPVLFIKQEGDTNLDFLDNNVQ